MSSDRLAYRDSPFRIAMLRCGAVTPYHERRNAESDTPAPRKPRLARRTMPARTVVSTRMTASAMTAGMASSQPQYASMTTTAAAAAMAALLALTGSTMAAAARAAR